MLLSMMNCFSSTYPVEIQLRPGYFQANSGGRLHTSVLKKRHSTRLECEVYPILYIFPFVFCISILELERDQGYLKKIFWLEKCAHCETYYEEFYAFTGIAIKKTFNRIFFVFLCS